MKHEEQLVHVATRVPASVAERIDRLAERSGRSRSAVVRFMLEEFVGSLEAIDVAVRPVAWLCRMFGLSKTPESERAVQAELECGGGV